MKVVFVLMTFPLPSETFISNDISDFMKSGIDCAVITLRGKHSDYDNMIRQRKLSGLHISTANIKSYFSGFFQMVIMPVLVFKTFHWIIKKERNYKKILKSITLLPVSFNAIKQIKVLSPDVVHLMWGHYPSIVSWLVKNSLPRIKLSMFLGAYDLEQRLAISGQLGEYDADVVWTHAKVNIAAIKELGIPEEKIKVVYRGINLNKIPASEAVRSDRIISAGRLIKSKGFDRLISVFKIIKDKCPNSELVIFGDGPEKKNLINLANELGLSDSVIFRGHQTQDVIFKEMSHSKLFLFLTSHKSERLPNVIKEAMACGCICISSVSPGIEELIQNGTTGFVVTLANKHDIALRAISILDNFEQFKSIQHNSKIIISSLFDRKNSTSMYINYWQKLVTSNRHQ